MIHHMLIHPSLRYLMALPGKMLLLHSGAIAKNGRSLIFTGRGGAGKTTLTSLVLAYGGPGWSLHSDDYTFLCPGPRSYAYMTRSHLYLDLLRWVPEIGKRLTASERLGLELFGRVRAWSRQGIKWPVRMPVGRMWPGMQVLEEAVPAAILFLRRADVERPEVETVEVGPELVNDLVEMNFGEARHYLHLVQKARAVEHYAEWLEEWRQAEQRLIETALSQVPVKRLVLPSRKLETSAFRQSLVQVLNQFVES